VRFRIISALLPAVLIANPLHAQDTTRTRILDTLTVTAERRPASATVTPATVRVVTSAQLMSRGAVDLVSYLRDVPGLQLDPVVGSGIGVSMQGLGSDRVQILIDGAPVAGRLNNQFDLTRFNPLSFARVEIVEGPQSTLYGSTALGGVINLITRAPDGRRYSVAATGGSFGQLDLSGRFSTLLGTTALQINGGRRHVDIAPGYVSVPAGAANRWNAGAGVLVPIGSAVLDVRAMHLGEEQQYPASYGPGASFSNLAHTHQTDVLAAMRLDDDATELRAHASIYTHTLDATNLASGSTSVDPQTQRLADVEVIHRATAGKATWLAGARGEHEWITTARLTDASESATTAALFGSMEFALTRRLSLSAGARETIASRWGNDFAPRLGATWRDEAGSYGKVALAHGFRAPSFTEQFSDFVNSEAFYAVIGNPDLKAEHSWNITAEVGHQTRNLSLYLRGFANRLRDFIEANYTGQQGQIAQFTYQNVGRARTAGGEAGGSISRGMMTVSGSYAYLDAQNESDDQPLLGRAKHAVRGAVSVGNSRASLTAEAVRNSAVPISADRNTGDLIYQGAAARVNLRANTVIGGIWRITAGVDNVGNEIPENAIAGLGRRWFAGIAVDR
jgi:outer membrane receptor for ferrienterochelin and colicins